MVTPIISSEIPIIKAERNLPESFFSQKVIGAFLQMIPMIERDFMDTSVEKRYYPIQIKSLSLKACAQRDVVLTILFPGYKKKHFLGEGSAKQAFVALKWENGDLSLCKCLKLEENGEAKRIQRLQQSVFREARIANLKPSLADGIVPTIGQFKSDNIHLFFQKYYNMTLYEFMKYPVSREIAPCIAIGLIKALQWLNNNNVIHRDLKPENVLVDVSENGSLEVLSIADFDVSTILALKNELKAFTGTYSYICPEMLELLDAEKSNINLLASKISTKVDIWAFANIIYVLLIGSLPSWTLIPFKRGATQERLKAMEEQVNQIEPPQYLLGNHLKDVPQNVIDILKKCFSMQPNNRPYADELVPVFNQWLLTISTSHKENIAPLPYPISIASTKLVSESSSEPAILLNSNKRYMSTNQTPKRSCLSPLSALASPRVPPFVSPRVSPLLSPLRPMAPPLAPFLGSP